MTMWVRALFGFHDANRCMSDVLDKMSNAIKYHNSICVAVVGFGQHITFLQIEQY
jgi:hypothetical protein